MNISISKSFFKDRLRITVGSTLTDNPEVNQTSGLLSSLSAEQQTEQSGNTPSMADKARHAVRHTIITKQVVNLFIKNMSENDEHKE